ncbi:branched-chain amino acid ABC transporter permease [Jatrophihabitans endophyticus]
MAVDWIGFDTSAFVDLFWPNTVQGLAFGSVYALIAIGYTLVYGVLRLINFAHSEVFITGSFAAYATLRLTGFEPGVVPGGVSGFEIALYAILAVAVAALASGGTALVVERVAYRPLRGRNAPPLVFLITAIGASLVIQQLYFNFVGQNAQPALFVVQQNVQFNLFSAPVTNVQILLFVAAIVLMFAVDLFIRTTRLGRGIRAVAQDPTTATLMGVNRERVFMLTFVIGGIVAGIGAALYMMYRPATVLYNGGFLLGIKAFVAAVLGGIGNLRGALLGGMILGLAENYGQTLFGGQWKDVVAFVLLIVILMFRPTGILGESMGRARV